MLHCEEWPCLLELPTPPTEGDPTGYGAVEAAERRLAAAGFEAELIGSTGGLSSVGRFEVRPSGWWPDPGAELRTAARMFWLAEGDLP
ncbi:MAG: hypothetical protein ABMA64_38645 [Myxococcota bacterium]